MNLAPGWYHDGVALRWWDGATWSPPVPPPPPNGDNQKTMAILAHLGGITGGFLVPLILFVIQKDRGSLARHHAAEALNFQLTMMIAQFGSVLLGFGGLVIQLATAAGSGALDDGGEFFPWTFFLLFPLFFLVMVANIVCSIIGMVKASHLERWRYPVSIRFVKP